MCAIKNAWIVPALILSATSASAEDIPLAQTPVSASQISASHGAPHIKFETTFLEPVQKEVGATAEPAASIGSTAISKTSTVTSSPDNPNQPGMRWTIDEQRPSLEYRLNENKSVGLHFARHGAVLNLHWGF